MKLNLLPKHVAKSQGAKGALFMAVLIVGASAVGLYWLMTSSQAALAEAKEPIPQLRSTVETAMGNSIMADTVIADMTNIDRNIKLTSAMLAHNTSYVSLYREVLGNVPSYYRVMNLNASPTGPDGCVVTMSGVLKTHQQYADLVIALYRMPGVTNVTRGGYTFTAPRVPSLVEPDQIGTPVKPGEANLPSDPEERMAELIQRANEPTGFLGVNNFGTENTLKGAMPEWSNVTVSLTITGRNIQTPNPRGTLLAGGGGPAGP
jgi:hypothetical protein